MKNKKKIRIGTNVKKLSFAVIGALGLAGNAYAIDISTFIPAGKLKSYVEKNANLWFVLDNSGSMQQPGRRTNKWNLYLDLGFIPYDSNLTYTRPKRVDGTDMPFPPEGKYWQNPFYKDSLGKNPSDWPTYNNVYYLSGGKYRTLQCDGTENCRIWANFYRTRIFTLKSSLSLVINSEKNEEILKQVRIGYRNLSYDGPYNTYDPPYEYLNSEHILPVLPLGGDKGEENKQSFNRWLYAIRTGGRTPLRGVASSVIHKVVDASAGMTADNPFLQKPGEAYNEKTNKLVSCRRNYNILLTDGGWNTSKGTDINPNLTSPAHIKNKLLNEEEELPDGEVYKPIAPYKYVEYDKNGYEYGYKQPYNYYVRTLADIAFAGWKTDLDNKPENNDIEPKHHEIAGVDKSDYWHPYNDRANWQHLNTFTIGFGLDNPNNISINPGPDSKIADYLDENWKWKLKILFANNAFTIEATGDDTPIRDLANAALAGRGRFYDVQTHEDMIEAFNNILDDTKPGPEQPTTSGSSGVVGNSQQRGGSIFTTKYDIDNATGSLMRKKIYDGGDTTGCFTSTPADKQTVGQVCDVAIWDAAEVLSTGSINDRNIFSLQRTDGTSGLTDETSKTVTDIKYKSIDFTIDSLSEFQKNRLVANFPPVLKDNVPTDEERLKKLFSYVRGSDANENIFRSRANYEYTEGTKARNILGAIVRSRPIYAGVPQAYTKHLDRGSNAYKNYLTFVRNFTTGNENGEKEILYVGADDGMVHAFDATTGKEKFAYVPTTILKSLPNTVVPKGNVSLVDGNIYMRTVNFGANSDDNLNDEWNRVLVGGFGGGAKGLYALNITDPTVAGIKANNKAKWEYSNLESIAYQKKKGNITDPNEISKLKSNVGNILAKPGIIQLHDNTWVAIVGNGYNSESKKAAVIVIDLKTGKPIQELVLPADDTKENGLGAVTSIPYAGKPEGEEYLADRAYAGDLQGNLWVFDLEGSNKTDGIKLKGKLFTAESKDGKPQSITVEPLVVTHPFGYGNLVHFGTGSLFSRDDASSRVQNTVYAIWDDWISKDNGGLPHPRTEAVTDAELNKVVLEPKQITMNGKPKSIRVLASSNDPIDWKLDTGTHRGWRIDLEKGERAWQHPQVLYGGSGTRAVVYRTANYHIDPDAAGGAEDTSGEVKCSSKQQDVKGSELQFNMGDASKAVDGFGALDVNKSGKLDKGDTHDDAAITGNSTLNVIPYNSINGVIGKGDSESGTGGGSGGGNCKIMSVTTASSDGKQSTTKIEVCSSFSSWQELK